MEKSGLKLRRVASPRKLLALSAGRWPIGPASARQAAQDARQGTRAEWPPAQSRRVRRSPDQDCPAARGGASRSIVSPKGPHIEPDAGDIIEAMIFSFSTAKGCHAVLETSCRMRVDSSPSYTHGQRPFLY